MGKETAAPPQCLCHRRPCIGAQKWIRGRTGTAAAPTAATQQNPALMYMKTSRLRATAQLPTNTCKPAAVPERRAHSPGPSREAPAGKGGHQPPYDRPAPAHGQDGPRQNTAQPIRCPPRPQLCDRLVSGQNMERLNATQACLCAEPAPPFCSFYSIHHLRTCAPRIGIARARSAWAGGQNLNPSQPSLPPLPAQAARRLRRRGEHRAAVGQRRVRVRPGRLVRGGRRRGLAAAAQRRQRLRASQQRVAVVRVARQVLIVHLRGARASPLSAKRRSSGQGAPSGAHRDRRRLFAWRIFLGAAVGSAAGARHLHVRPSTTWTCGRLRGARPACASRALAHHEAQPHWSRRAWGRSRMAAAGPAEQGLQRPCERASETQRAARALGSRERAAGRACRAAAGWPARRSTAPRQSRTGANWRSGSM